MSTATIGLGIRATLPHKWKSVALGDLCEHNLGKMLDRQKNEGVLRPYLRNPNVKWFDFDLTDVKEMPIKDSERSKYSVRPGDVIVCEGGEAGRAAIWNGEADEMYIQKALHRVRVGPELHNRYLVYVLMADAQSGHLNSYFTGTTIPHFTGQDLHRYTIPLPPLSEQKRIADILDKADAIRRKRQETKELAGTFQEGLFCEMFGDPIVNEMNWPAKSFGELATNQDGRRRPVKASDRKNVQGEYPYYGASGIIDYVDSYIFDETALLIGEDGANLLARSTPIAFLATGKYWVNNHAHVVTPNGKATLLYLATHLNMRSILDFVTGSAQPKLNQANLNKIPIPCPPRALQEEFDRRVNTFDLIREKQEIADKEAGAVFNSLVQRAFKGEL